METSLCRICLRNDLGFTLFDTDTGEGFSLISKLELCVHEQVLDQAGYPRIICKTCNDNLNSACNFINKYKDTCRVLQSGLPLNEDIAIKQEKCDPIDDGNENDSVNHEQHKELNTNDEAKPLDKQTLEKLLVNCKNITVKTIKKNKKNSPVKIKKEKCSVTPNVKQVHIKKEKVINIEPIHNINKKEEEKTEADKHLLCDICAAVLKSSNSLKRHIESLHYPAHIQCEQCPKVFNNSSNLKRHVQAKHSAGRYICPSCGKSFYHSHMLQTHIKVVHLNNKKRYSCQYCNRSFASGLSSIIHGRSAHTGQRPAKCEVCGSCFYHEIYLREHMRLHTGERPFKCPVCGRGHVTRCNMKSHLKNNHRLSEIDPEIVANLRPYLLKALKP